MSYTGKGHVFCKQERVFFSPQICISCFHISGKLHKNQKQCIFKYFPLTLKILIANWNMLIPFLVSFFCLKSKNLMFFFLRDGPPLATKSTGHGAFAPSPLLETASAYNICNIYYIMYIIDIMYTFLFWEHIYVIKLSGPYNFMLGYVSSYYYLYLGVILTIQLWLVQYSSG